MKIQTKIPLYLRFIIFNVVMLTSLGFTGRLGPDWPSIVAVILALIVMNVTGTTRNGNRYFCPATTKARIIRAFAVGGKRNETITSSP
jgi:hypothetical protein